jgi:ketosteroid isomerase-like protein
MTAIETINHFFQAIIDKNAEKIGTFYVQDEQTYVVLEGPRLTTLGFSKIQKGWFDFCDSELTLDKIQWLEGPFSEEENKMAWVGGIIKLTVSIGEKPFEQTFRASFVLKKLKKVKNTEGGWLIRHEHVSGALTDPYGIGDWLKNKS